MTIFRSMFTRSGFIMVAVLCTSPSVRKYSSLCLFEEVNGACIFITTVKAGTLFSSTSALIIPNNGSCEDMVEIDCTHTVHWTFE